MMVRRGDVMHDLPVLAEFFEFSTVKLRPAICGQRPWFSKPAEDVSLQPSDDSFCPRVIQRLGLYPLAVGVLEHGYVRVAV